jgi:hypothetical protein
MVKIDMNKTSKLPIPVLSFPSVPAWLFSLWERENRRKVSTILIALSGRVFNYSLPDMHLSSLPSISPRRGLTVSCAPGVTDGYTTWENRTLG